MNEEEENGPTSGEMRDLLKRALGEPPPPPPDQILHGVQKKLRQRSRGKFYGDGWSTSQLRTGYVLAAVALLVLFTLAYLLMAPGSILGAKSP